MFKLSTTLAISDIIIAIESHRSDVTEFKIFNCDGRNELIINDRFICYLHDDCSEEVTYLSSINVDRLIQTLRGMNDV